MRFGSCKFDQPIAGCLYHVCWSFVHEYMIWTSHCCSSSTMDIWTHFWTDLEHSHLILIESARSLSTEFHNFLFAVEMKLALEILLNCAVCTMIQFRPSLHASIWNMSLSSRLQLRTYLHALIEVFCFHASFKVLSSCFNWEFVSKLWLKCCLIVYFNW